MILPQVSHVIVVKQLVVVASLDRPAPQQAVQLAPSLVDPQLDIETKL